MDLADIALINEAIDARSENERRYREATQK